jgi:hypothetical protein
VPTSWEPFDSFTSSEGITTQLLECVPLTLPNLAFSCSCACASLEDCPFNPAQFGVQLLVCVCPCLVRNLATTNSGGFRLPHTCATQREHTVLLLDTHTFTTRAGLELVGLLAGHMLFEVH